MELILANHSSYPRIGDEAEYQVLRRTIAQFERGEKNDSDLSAAEGRMTELALREQIDAGLDIVTDGQVRWYDPISHLAGKLAGVRINGLLRFFDTNFYFRQPVVHSNFARTKPLVVEDFQFARNKCSRPVKPVLTGPATLARHSRAENGMAGGFEKMVEDYTQALAEEVGALAVAGATLIQVDEPSLLKHPEDLPLAELCMARLAARKGAAQLALAVYFADPAPACEKLQKLPVDVLALDFTYGPKLVDIVASSGSSKVLALGLVNARNTKMEDPSAVARQIERMGKKLAASRAYLSPSCGLEYLPRDRAQMKLKTLLAIKKTLLGGPR